MPIPGFEAHLLPEDELVPGPYMSVGIIGAGIYHLLHIHRVICVNIVRICCDHHETVTHGRAAAGCGKSTLIDLFCAVCPFCEKQPTRLLSSDHEQQRPTQESPPVPVVLEQHSSPAADGDADGQEQSRGTGWAVSKNTQVQSLMWYCRQSILQYGIGYNTSLLPERLTTYLNEIRSTQCDFCQMIGIKYVRLVYVSTSVNLRLVYVCTSVTLRLVYVCLCNFLCMFTSRVILYTRILIHSTCSSHAPSSSPAQPNPEAAAIPKASYIRRQNNQSFACGLQPLALV